MPIVISKDIPAYKILNDENIFIMPDDRALSQDIRPIEIAILNLMPTKIETETQFLRLLSNTPLQVNVTFIKTESYKSTHTCQSHLNKFYKTFSQIKNKHFDGMIITGAPIETMPFEEVAYWKELTKILDFADKNVTSTLFICWGAQAGLYYHYGINKVELPKKLFGIFSHEKLNGNNDPLLKGFDDIFYIPHSRHTTIKVEDIEKVEDLEILSVNSDAGASIIKSKDGRRIFVTGHMEYDKDTLKTEYERDLSKGLPIEPPINYFTDDSCTTTKALWFSTANLFYSNWLNYYVYQVTPYKL